MTSSSTTAPTIGVQVRFFAAAAEAAGTSHEQVALPDGGTGADLVAALGAAHGEALARVLAISSLLVEGVVAEDLAAPLAAPGTASLRVDVLPPFAGG
ncbi:molybdopterin synthase sulfur carrier subunit [Flavimobilis marinus]|uniref:Molybdopterin converting factor, small subunit n=1 Tax=Flavimobilis marinus TaxID=285351 RepID=A0A1I2CYF3_9MICO|nr:MoaD/ThiS family protein [Flavimobilis marinus]GHG46597.1 molybdopterin synthase sulfur carrier subunit [Flavimobilis marinus]SFE73331.1 Molybdopterin converting factor, small subunit [Flavimobilis marinus]